MAYLGQTLNQNYDTVTNETGAVDRFRNLKVAQAKRMFGFNFGATIDTTFGFTVTPTNGGTFTASNGSSSLATNTTANGAVSFVTKQKARSMAGRNNLIRFAARFNDTGTVNNVREFGVFVNSNNGIYFRLSGTTFSVVTKRNGVETVVNNGSFNGNGSLSNYTYPITLTNFNSFELLYSASRVYFIINDTAIHTVSSETTSYIGSLLGNVYASTVNSGGITTNCSIEFVAISASQLGSVVNNPNFYHVNATTETTTLKSGGGTLQSVSIGRSGGNGATLTVYDNTAGSGTIIGIWDLNNVASVGTHILGVEGVNFNNGLTIVTSGTMTAASVTIFWE